MVQYLKYLRRGYKVFEILKAPQPLELQQQLKGKV